MLINRAEIAPHRATEIDAAVTQHTGQHNDGENQAVMDIEKKAVKPGPGLPKERNRLNGGQQGGADWTLRRVSQLDHLEAHFPAQCLHCDQRFGSFEPDEVIGSRQVLDIPEPKLEVTEHRIGRIECCGVMYEGE